MHGQGLCEYLWLGHLYARADKDLPIALCWIFFFLLCHPFSESSLERSSEGLYSHLSSGERLFCRCFPTYELIKAHVLNHQGLADAPGQTLTIYFSGCFLAPTDFLFIPASSTMHLKNNFKKCPLQKSLSSSFRCFYWEIYSRQLGYRIAKN